VAGHVLCTGRRAGLAHVASHGAERTSGSDLRTVCWDLRPCVIPAGDVMRPADAVARSADNAVGAVISGDDGSRASVDVHVDGGAEICQ
jgi:hypothetical protein